MSEVAQPPPPSNLSFMHVDLLAAAMQKLGITNVSATELLTAIKQEGEQMRKAPASSAERRKVLLRRKFHHKNDRNITVTLSKYFMQSPNPTPPTTFDPKVQERRRRLRSLTKAAFPDGRVPDPYTSIWINEFGGDANKNLPFVRAHRS
jgi:hypothetical protein